MRCVDQRNIPSKQGCYARVRTYTLALACMHAMHARVHVIDACVIDDDRAARATGTYGRSSSGGPSAAIGLGNSRISDEGYDKWGHLLLIHHVDVPFHLISKSSLLGRARADIMFNIYNTSRSKQGFFVIPRRLRYEATYRTSVRIYRRTYVHTY